MEQIILGDNKTMSLGRNITISNHTRTWIGDYWIFVISVYESPIHIIYQNTREIGLLQFYTISYPTLKSMERRINNQYSIIGDNVSTAIYNNHWK